MVDDRRTADKIIVNTLDTIQVAIENIHVEVKEINGRIRKNEIELAVLKVKAAGIAIVSGLVASGIITFVVRRFG